jgi:hypothetical protein
VLEVVRKSQLGRNLGKEGMHINLEIASAKYQAMQTEKVLG